MAKKLSRKQRKLMKMKESVTLNNVGKVDAEADNIQLDSVAIQVKPLTFGKICVIVINIIITIAIFISILAAWIYCLTNYERGFGSILIVVIPFTLVIITLFIIFLKKITKKLGGFY